MFVTNICLLQNGVAYWPDQKWVQCSCWHLSRDISPSGLWAMMKSCLLLLCFKTKKWKKLTGCILMVPNLDFFLMLPSPVGMVLKFILYHITHFKITKWCVVIITNRAVTLLKTSDGTLPSRELNQPVSPSSQGF